MMFSAFEAECATNVLRSGGGAMRKGTYKRNATLGSKRYGALEWELSEKGAERGWTHDLVALIMILTFLRSVLTCIIPTHPNNFDPVKLTEPWDLGIENLE